MYSFSLDSPDPDARQVALVRNEVDDVTAVSSPAQGSDYFVTDERILAFLASARQEAPEDANEVEVRLMGCAAILDTLATNQAYVLKVGRTLGVEERDGAKVADAIRSHAKSCRARALSSSQDRRKLAEAAAAQARQYQAPSTGSFRTRTGF